MKVELKRNELIACMMSKGRVSSIQIAKAFNRRHDQITKLIKRYLPSFNKFGEIKKVIAKTGGRPTTEYFVTEDQFIFLISLLGNSQDVVEFKRKLVSKYTKLEQLNP
jgi:phage regulator Rha-like protein